jgi:hypothetical protein
MASESNGDKVHVVNMIERTPNLRNSSIASPFCCRCLRRGFSSLLNLRAWARRSWDLGAGRCPRRSMARAALRLGDRALALLILVSGAPTSLSALACLLGTYEIMLYGCARRVDRHA